VDPDHIDAQRVERPVDSFTYVADERVDGAALRGPG
jgi:hypothetical protein